MTMQEDRLKSLESLEEFLRGTAGLSARMVGTEAERQGHVRDVLKRFSYLELKKAQKSVVRRYLEATSGYSRQHLTRLIKRFREHAPLGQRKPPEKGFARRYTAKDIALLAETDKAHENLNGAATRHVFHRALHEYGDERYRRLASISVSHLYNLRHSLGYREARGHWEGTKPSKNVSIALRKRPEPEGRAGFLRIDSVHQGDEDGVKGVYYINAVDCVTQWEVVACCEKISEAFLLPLLEHLLESFPFRILGVHADNGSEYINHRVACLLDKLNAEFTKSRPRHSNDNALVECKNGGVIRKAFGYAHIPQKHAARLNRFCQDTLVPYLNLHRPCRYPERRMDDKGKVRVTYPLQLTQTPLEKLASLPEAARNLKPNVRLCDLRDEAKRLTDNQTAERMRTARAALFQEILRARKRA
ncbi:MAG: integrase [Candidatus Accumulibacter sp.]|nr:integrase [Accumulibacter sp.]